MAHRAEPGRLAAVTHACIDGDAPTCTHPASSNLELYGALVRMKSVMDAACSIALRHGGLYHSRIPYMPQRRLLDPANVLIIRLASLVLSISLLSISSILSSMSTGPKSSLSHQSRQTPNSGCAPVRLVVLGPAPGAFSCLACSLG